MTGKCFQVYCVKPPRKYIISKKLLSCLPSLSKLSPMLLSAHSLSSRKRKKAHSPRLFRKLFSTKGERDGGNYDLIYQNSIGKYEDDLEH